MRKYLAILNKVIIVLAIAWLTPTLLVGCGAPSKATLGLNSETFDVIDRDGQVWGSLSLEVQSNKNKNADRRGTLSLDPRKSPGVLAAIDEVGDDDDNSADLGLRYDQQVNHVELLFNDLDTRGSVTFQQNFPSNFDPSLFRITLIEPSGGREVEEIGALRARK